MGSFEYETMRKPRPWDRDGHYGRLEADRRKYPKSLDVVERFDGQGFADTELLWFADGNVSKAFAKALDYSIETLNAERKMAHGFYLHSSEPGRCKTSIANCVRELMLSCSIECEAVNAKLLMRLLKSNAPESRAHLEDIRDYTAFVIVDDVGIEDLSKLGYSGQSYNDILYDVLNSRLNKGLVTAFTSNYTPQELIERGYSIQVVDRMRELSQDYFIEVDGKSLRGSVPERVDEAMHERRKQFVIEKLKSCHAPDALEWDRAEDELWKKDTAPLDPEVQARAETNAKNLLAYMKGLTDTWRQV